MKFPSTCRSSRAGFTLIELLVVIGIIAILAGVTLSGVSSAIKFAKRTKANTTASQISTAVQNYYTEYGVYPMSNTADTTDEYYDGAAAGNWPAMVETLSGNINPLTGASNSPGFAGENTRNIAYLSFTRSDLDPTTGSPLNPFGINVNAPFYYMVVDTDYSGVAGDTGTGTSKMMNFSPGTNPPYVVPLGHGVPGGVAVWCACDQNPGSATSLATQWAHTY